MAFNITYELPALLSGMAAYQGGTAGATMQAAQTRAEQNAASGRQFSALMSQGIQNAYGVMQQRQQQAFQVQQAATAHGYDMDHLSAQNKAEMDRQAFGATGMTADEMRTAAGQRGVPVSQIYNEALGQRGMTVADAHSAEAIQTAAGLAPIREQENWGNTQNHLYLQQQEDQARAAAQFQETSARMNAAGYEWGVTQGNHAQIALEQAQGSQIQSSGVLAPDEIAKQSAESQKRIAALSVPNGWVKKQTNVQEMVQSGQAAWQDDKGNTWLAEKDGTVKLVPARNEPVTFEERMILSASQHVTHSYDAEGNQIPVNYEKLWGTIHGIALAKDAAEEHERTLKMQEQNPNFTGPPASMQPPSQAAPAAAPAPVQQAPTRAPAQQGPPVQLGTVQVSQPEFQALLSQPRPAAATVDKLNQELLTLANKAPNTARLSATDSARREEILKQLLVEKAHQQAGR